MTMQGMIADLYPRARPKMMSVAAPVLQESATSCTTYSQVSDWVQHNAKTRIRLNTAQRKAKTQTGYCTTHRPGSDWIRHIRQPTADELGSCTTPTAQSQVQCRYNMPTSLGQHHQTDLILWTCWYKLMLALRCAVSRLMLGSLLIQGRVYGLREGGGSWSRSECSPLR